MAPKKKRTPDQLILSLWLKGRSYRDIADLLTRNGLPISHQTIKNRLRSMAIIKPNVVPRHRVTLELLHSTAKRLLVKNNDKI